MLVHGFPHVLLQTRENNYCNSLFGSHYCLPDRNGRVTTEPIKPLAWNFWTWSALASKVVNLMWTWELLAQVLRPGWFRGKESACQYRRCRSHPWHRKIPWRRKWQPTQYSYLENSMDREAWRATVHGVTKSRTWLSDLAHAVAQHTMWASHTSFWNWFESRKPASREKQRSGFQVRPSWSFALLVISLHRSNLLKLGLPWWPSG